MKGVVGSMEAKVDEQDRKNTHYLQDVLTERMGDVAMSLRSTVKLLVAIQMSLSFILNPALILAVPEVMKFAS